MSGARVVLAVGLFLEIVGTLIVSWDVRKGQDATKSSVSVLQYLIRLGNGDAAYEMQIGNTNQMIMWIRLLDPASANQQLTSIRAKMKKDVETLEILRDAEPEARERTNAIVDRISNELIKRKMLIYSAIALVFFGGVLEFIASVWLGA